MNKICPLCKEQMLLVLITSIEECFQCVRSNCQLMQYFKVGSKKPHLSSFKRENGIAILNHKTKIATSYVNGKVQNIYKIS